jgi:hypothetical protein
MPPFSFYEITPHQHAFPPTPDHPRRCGIRVETDEIIRRLACLVGSKELPDIRIN